MSHEQQPDKIMADLGAERIVLGSMILSRSAADNVIEILSSRDFYQPNHATIYTTLLAQLGSDQPVDAIALARALAESGQLERVGGANYLHTLVASVPVAAQAGHFARIVQDWSVRRQVLESAVRVAQAAQDLSKSVGEVVEDASRAIHDAATGQVGPSLEPLSGFMDDAIEMIKRRRNGDGPQFLTTGLADLDTLLGGGWEPGQLAIVAGRPGMGKSVASLGFAKAAAEAGRPAIFFALEMKKAELSRRLLADEAQVNLLAIRTGELTDGEMDRLEQAKLRLAKLPLHIDDRSNTMSKIWAEARRFRQRHGDLGLCVVDYVQRLSSSGPKGDNRRDLEVGDNAKQLKDLSMALDTTAIGVCQLNRGVEMRMDKRPGSADLRDSGQLEQEADIILMLYRDDKYVKESPRAGEADLICTKQRNGEEDTVTVAAQLHFQRFRDVWRDRRP